MVGNRDVIGRARLVPKGGPLLFMVTVKLSVSPFLRLVLTGLNVLPFTVESTLLDCPRFARHGLIFLGSPVPPVGTLSTPLTMPVTQTQ